ncbi:unnamed protein product, partial [Didymodactylos carnosus]
DDLNRPLLQSRSHKHHRTSSAPIERNRQNSGRRTQQMNQSTADSDNVNSCLLDRKLPKELLLRIFSHLDYKALCRCAQVSKYWNSLALDGSNWQSINLKGFQRDVEGSVLENLSKRCGTFLKRLNIENCRIITDMNMRVLANHCPNLDRLIMKNCTKLSNA